MKNSSNPVNSVFFLKSRTLAALVAVCAFSLASAQDAPALMGGPIQSAPSMRVGGLAALQAPLTAASAPVSGLTSPVDPASAKPLVNPLSNYSAATQLAVSNVFSDTVLPTPGELETDLGWMILLNDRPNGILIPQVRADASVLMVDIPSAQEVQMQMPGRMLDQAESARFQVVQYFNNTTQEAARIRTGQFENIQAWVNYVKTLHLKLSSDPWQRWYFGVQVQAYLRPVYAQLFEQSRAPDAQLLKTSQSYVERISPLLSAAGTQEARVAWYGVLLQFKQGMTGYRQQVQQSDARTLAVITDYMLQYPTPVKPPGVKPVRSTASNENSSQPVAAMNVIAKKESGESKPAAVNLQDTSSTSGALIVTGIVLMVLGYIYLKIRQRIKLKTKQS